MQSISKLPYKTQFDPDYEEFSKRIEKFNIKNSSNIQFSSEMVTTLLDISTRAKESVRDDDLEYEHSNIYVQYASQNQMKDGQKNITDHCPGCGDGMKKNVQCSFCGIVYCKNCCFRKRVMPTLSGPKDSRDECNDCHSKFVKLFANQYTILQKIIESTSKKISKLEEDSAKKRGKFQQTQKRKKALKIKQNVLEKERQKEEKKLQDLNERLRQAYQIAADKKRKQEEKHEAFEKEKIESAKKIREQKQREEKKEREQRELKQRIEKEQKQKKDRLVRQSQAQKQKQMVKQRERKRVEIERQQQNRKNEQNARIQQQQRKLAKQKQAQQEIQKSDLLRVQKAQSLEMHKEEANILKDLAENIVHHPIQHKQAKNKVQTTPIVVKIEDQQRIEPVVNIFEGLRKSYDEDISVNNSFNVQGSPKSNNNNLSDYFGEEDQNPKPNFDSKTTEGDVEQTSIEQLKQKNREVDSIYKYKQMPQVAINVSEMTVNQLLGIHVNLEKDGASLTHNKSNRDSLNFEERRKSLIRSSVEMPKDDEITLSQQQKQMIFKKSLLTASAVPTIRQDQHQQEYHVADPAGSKCTCNLM